jgi:hypothetical protein
MPKSEAIAPSDKRVIQTLLWALKPLSNLRRSISLQYAVTFLTVALEEGKSSGTYARELGFNRYHMSRYLHSIGNQARGGGSGLGLITIKRITGSHLTEKSRAVAAEVFGNLRRLVEVVRK